MMTDPKKDDQLVDEATMETVSIAPPKPGEEDGADDMEDGPDADPDQA